MPILIAWALVALYVAFGLTLADSKAKPRKRRQRPKIEILDSRVINDPYPAFDHKAIIYKIRVTNADGVSEVMWIGHWSGRFDGPAGTLVMHLMNLIKRFDLVAITTTESQQKGALQRLRKALKRLSKPRIQSLEDAVNEELAKHSASGGWTARQRGEYICVTSNKVFHIMPKVKPLIKVLTDIPGYAGWRNLRVGRFVARHRTLGVAFAWFVFHGPSDIQNGDWFGGSANQIKIAHKGFPRLARQLARFRRKKPDAVVIAPGDTNASARAPRLHSWFQRTIGGKSIWDGRMPPRGVSTHGGDDRIIDDVFIPDAA